jgi:VanZ like family
MTDATSPSQIGTRPGVHRRSTAGVLLLVWTALIVYASWFPFMGWADRGIAPWAFVVQGFEQGWPRYWTLFDVAGNVLAYAVWAFLFAVWRWRSGAHVLVPQAQLQRAAKPLASAWGVLVPVPEVVRRWPLPAAFLLGVALSFVMEAVQTYLPQRVSAASDWWCNSAGALLGALVAWGMQRFGVLQRWSKWRHRWFVARSQAGLALLLLWPFALLFPAPVPFALGQVWERVLDVWEAVATALGLDDALTAPATHALADLQRITAPRELLLVSLGLLVPVLVSHTEVPKRSRRLIASLVIVAVGWLATTVSAALSFGPEQAWSWWNVRVQSGVVLSFVVALACAWAPPRIVAVMGVVVASVWVTLVNQVPIGAYFWQTLQTWEQGRFIRFHGLAQWIGWLWPYAAIAFLATRAAQRDEAF